MRISVIIPTLNEQQCIADTLVAVRRERPHQVLVVDGGSTDGTPELARDADQVLHCTPGRAAQMNAGAAQATGDALLFLHADCRPGASALDAVRRVLAHRSTAGGCLRMRVDAAGWLYRCIDCCATARVQLTGIVYGDQGLFLRRELFERVGGFPLVRFMEDILLSLSLRKHGRMVVAPAPVFVSPRRWQQRGIIRQTLRNWGLTLLAAAGVNPNRLARYYPTVR